MNGYRDYMRVFSLAAGETGLTGIGLGIIFVFAPGEKIYIPFVWWIAFLGIQILADFLLLRWEISLNLYLIFNVAAAAAEAYCAAAHASFVSLDGFVLGFIVICACLTAASAAAGAYRVQNIRWNLRCVDALVAATAVYLLTSYAMGQATERDILLMAAAALILNLAAVNFARVGEDHVFIIQGCGAGGRLVILGVLFLCALFAAAGAAAASGDVHSMADLILTALRIIWHAAETVLTLFAMAVGYIVLFFMWIIPGGNNALEEKMQGETQEIIGQVKTSAAVFPTWIWKWMGILTAAALLVWCLWKFRGVKIKRPRRTAGRKRIVRRSRLREEVMRLLKALADAAAFEWRYHRNRNTTAGLLVYAERRGKMKKYGRNRGESGGAYLRRLSEKGKEPLLSVLAEKTEMNFYGMEKEPLSAGECRRFREAIIRALASNNTEDCGEEKQN